MQSTVRFKSILVAIILIVAMLPIKGFSQAFPYKNPVSLSPSEFHQVLAGEKAKRLERAREAAALSSAEVASTQTNFDVLFYDVFIRVNDTTEVLYGSVRTVAKAVDASVSAIEVDLYSNMVVESIVAPSGSLAYTRSGNVITITLDQTYSQGEQFEYTIDYYGHPTEGGFQAFAFDSHDGKKSISSLSEPYYARTWWPCKDRMDDKADSFYIAIEVDTSFYVASNGLLDSVVQVSPNSETYFWTTRYPMVTYLFSLAIYPFTVWEDEFVFADDTMLLVHAVYPDQLALSLTSYGETPQILEVLSEQFGIYPYMNEKYGHANFEWGGGMEHQTMTSMAGSWFGFYQPVIIHEAAHQWWGDMITCESWADIWLNEGWASYAEALYYLETEGWASYQSYMNGMRYTGGGTIYVYDTTSVWMIFNGGRSYDKGAWVCHMLRGVLGDELFFQGVDAYYNSEYKLGAATTEKFKNVFEVATGVVLDWFFEQWIHGTYYPNYQYEFMSRWVPSGDYETYLYVAQTQTQDSTAYVFNNPIDFFVDFHSGPDDTMRFEITEREHLFKIIGTSTVADIKLDPSDWILKNTSKFPWQMHIITAQDELPEAEQHEAYSGRLICLGGSGVNSVSITSGALPSGFSINSIGSISGTCVDTGTYTFSVLFDDNSSSYSDEQEFSIRVAPRIWVPGDVDLTNGICDIGDLTALISYLYIGGSEPPSLNVADVNGDCVVDIADITNMIQYLFIDGYDMVIGCVN